MRTENKKDSFADPLAAGKNQRAIQARIRRVSGAHFEEEIDAVAVEEPLEIRLVDHPEDGRTRDQSISITMRTPGEDYELAVGFLFTEGIIKSADDLERPPLAIDTETDRLSCNVIEVRLKPGTVFDAEKLQRHFYATSSCGVCGKASLRALQVKSAYKPAAGRPKIPQAVIHGLGKLLRKEQSVFDETGGLHAAGLFDAEGQLLSLREDVGRHNATDKLIGAEILAGRVPLEDKILLVSGRSSFEILQKALMAGLPVVAAVGAPSSLAVSLAREFNQTLLGFVRDGRYNIYSVPERIVPD